ncbi:hypothetical protein SAY87_027284 [Trapa incisa]|uniref:Uncharacterized protein n=1 Tax=Trapa incisa TaxID=236973 RepID=A0AAN7H0N1_9MYRT|nr:hypothetical protein SAY87_027284 [Trapa incisa]
MPSLARKAGISTDRAHMAFDVAPDKAYICYVSPITASTALSLNPETKSLWIILISTRGQLPRDDLIRRPFYTRWTR